MNNNDTEKNPMLRCARMRPPCTHQNREHGGGKCWGVTIVRGVVGYCRCHGFLCPPESAPPGRQQEAA